MSKTREVKPKDAWGDAKRLFLAENPNGNWDFLPMSVKHDYSRKCLVERRNLMKGIRALNNRRLT